MPDSRDVLIERACAAVDSDRERIVALGEAIMDEPELGFVETRTASRVAETFGELELQFEQGLAVTGVKAVIKGARPGPRVALLGEMDALVVHDHHRANPETGAAHACGHNAQIAGLLGAARALVSCGAAAQLRGDIVLMAVPAEEYVELERRLEWVRQGAIEFPAGKPELVRLGHFDDVDMAVMIHTSSPAQNDGQVGVAVSSNGFLAKSVRFRGRAAHAGGAPERGVNALSAARLALQAVDAQRDTFRDQDCVRVHPIITRGGDLVNVVPADVRVETYVRAKTSEAMLGAARTFDRCMRGAALALGCQVEIETVPGYLPLRNDPGLSKVFRDCAARVMGEDLYREFPHSGGSTDAGDLSHIMPMLHPAVTGAAGVPHSAAWHIADPDKGYVVPAKILASMAIELLHGDAAVARQVLAGFAPAMTREEYLRQQRQLFNVETFDGASA